MIKFIAFFFALILFVIPCYSQNHDLLGWQEARWGMSEKEIEYAFTTEIKRLPERQIFKPSYVDNVIPDYDIEGRQYTVYFQMDKSTDKLSQVLINLNEMKSRVPRDAYFDGLDSLLTRKYGAPVYKRDDKQPYLISLSRQWVFPTTTIELEYDWLGSSGYSILSIRYFPTKTKDLKKI